MRSRRLKSPKTLEFTVKLTVEITEDGARKAVELITRCKANGEGSEIAKRQLNAFAKKNETTVEELEKAVALKVPVQYFYLTSTGVTYVKDVEGFFNEVLDEAASVPA